MLRRLKAAAGPKLHRISNVANNAAWLGRNVDPKPIPFSVAEIHLQAGHVLLEQQRARAVV